LKEDDRAILTAAARAEEAASLLLKLGGRVSDSVEADDAGIDQTNADALAA
jgi:antirestriction protein ArdC